MFVKIFLNTLNHHQLQYDLDCDQKLFWRRCEPLVYYKKIVLPFFLSKDTYTSISGYLAKTMVVETKLDQNASMVSSLIAAGLSVSCNVRTQSLFTKETKFHLIISSGQCLALPLDVSYRTNSDCYEQYKMIPR